MRRIGTGQKTEGRRVRLFSPAPVPAEPRVIFAGSLEEATSYKGLADLLHAMVNVRAKVPAAHLDVVVGLGPRERGVVGPAEGGPLVTGSVGALALDSGPLPPASELLGEVRPARGFAELPGTSTSFVDVPGHRRLVHTMIAGASADRFTRGDGSDWLTSMPGTSVSFSPSRVT